MDVSADRHITLDVGISTGILTTGHQRQARCLHASTFGVEIQLSICALSAGGYNHIANGSAGVVDVQVSRCIFVAGGHAQVDGLTHAAQECLVLEFVVDVRLRIGT